MPNPNTSVMTNDCTLDVPPGSSALARPVAHSMAMVQLMSSDSGSWMSSWLVPGSQRKNALLRLVNGDVDDSDAWLGPPNTSTYCSVTSARLMPAYTSKVQSPDDGHPVMVGDPVPSTRTGPCRHTVALGGHTIWVALNAADGPLVEPVISTVVSGRTPFTANVVGGNEKYALAGLAHDSPTSV